MSPSAQQGDGKPLHLLIVSNTDSTIYVSGGDRDWVNLLNAFGPERVRVTWAAPCGTELLGPYLDPRIKVRFLNIPFPAFYVLLHEAMYHRSLRTWLAMFKQQMLGLRHPLGTLRKSMRDDPPDMVITATSVELIGAVYAWIERLPHVWCVKEFLDPAVAACRRFAWLIEKLSNEVIVPSKAMAGAFSKRVRVLHDGSDLEAIRETTGQRTREQVLTTLDLPVRQPVIAQVGLGCWAKGQHVTAQAGAQLASEGQGPCTILFLGSFTDNRKQKLKDILSNAPESWQSSVRFVEFASSDFSYLSAADIVVHPSVFPDPYPNAVREALSLGKPVIGSRVGGIPELICDGETGLLVEPENTQQLGGALRKLINSPEERARLGEKARQFADAKLDIKLCKDAFFEVLLTLLKKR